MMRAIRSAHRQRGWRRAEGGGEGTRPTVSVRLVGGAWLARREGLTIDDAGRGTCDSHRVEPRHRHPCCLPCGRRFAASSSLADRRRRADRSMRACCRTRGGTGCGCCRFYVQEPRRAPFFRNQPSWSFWSKKCRSAASRSSCRPPLAMWPQQPQLVPTDAG